MFLYHKSEAKRDLQLPDEALAVLEKIEGFTVLVLPHVEADGEDGGDAELDSAAVVESELCGAAAGGDAGSGRRVVVEMRSAGREGTHFGTVGGRVDEEIIETTERLAVGERDAWQLARALDRPSLAALRAVVAAFARGERPAAEPQDETLATWAPEPEGALSRVDWSWPSERVLRRIRALSPVPGLALELCGQAFFVTR